MCDEVERGTAEMTAHRTGFYKGKAEPDGLWNSFTLIALTQVFVRCNVNGLAERFTFVRRSGRQGRQRFAPVCSLKSVRACNT